MTIAQQIKRQLDAKRTEAATKWTEFDEARKAALESGVDMTTGDAFESLHDQHKSYAAIAGEVSNLEARFMSALEMDGDPAKTAPVVDEPGKRSESRIWTPGQRVVDSQVYKQLAESGQLTKQGGVEIPSIEVASVQETKALITGLTDTSGGAFVLTDRQGYYPTLFAPYSIRNMVTVGQTDSDLVEWVKENSFTNAAAETAEATSVSDGAKPESALDFAIVQSSVRTIAHWIPATKRALADAGQLRTIIDQRLEDGVLRRLEAQMVAGTGSGENLRGILNTSGISTVAKGGAEPTVEAVLRGMTLIRLAFLEPTAVALHPNDYLDVRLMKDANGNYIMGPPNLPGPPQLWGLPVVVTTAVPQNTGLIGKFDEAILWIREGVSVSATDSHSDFFTKNLVAILAEGRFAFGVPRPAAFCSVTAI